MGLKEKIAESRRKARKKKPIVVKKGERFKGETIRGRIIKRRKEAGISQVQTVGAAKVKGKKIPKPEPKLTAQQIQQSLLERQGFKVKRTKAGDIIATKGKRQVVITRSGRTVEAPIEAKVRPRSIEPVRTTIIKQARLREREKEKLKKEPAGVIEISREPKLRRTFRGLAVRQREAERAGRVEESILLGTALTGAFLGSGFVKGLTFPFRLAVKPKAVLEKEILPTVEFLAKPFKGEAAPEIRQTLLEEPFRIAEIVGFAKGLGVFQKGAFAVGKRLIKPTRFIEFEIKKPPTEAQAKLLKKVSAKEPRLPPEVAEIKAEIDPSIKIVRITPERLTPKQLKGVVELQKTGVLEGNIEITLEKPPPPSEVGFTIKRKFAPGKEEAITQAKLAQKTKDAFDLAVRKTTPSAIVKEAFKGKRGEIELGRFERLTEAVGKGKKRPRSGLEDIFGRQQQAVFIDVEQVPTPRAIGRTFELFELPTARRLVSAQILRGVSQLPIVTVLPALITQQKTFLEQKITPSQLQRLSSRTELVQEQRLRGEQIIGQITGLTTRLTSRTEQIITPITGTITRQRLAPIIVGTQITELVETEKITGLEIPSIGLISEDRKREKPKKPQKVFNVTVRERGKDIKINKKRLPENRAKNLAADAVDNTPAASFRLRGAGSSKKIVRDDRSFFLSSKFTRKENVFTEKNKFRIDSRGEFLGITVKGWIARRKQFRGFL